MIFATPKLIANPLPLGSFNLRAWQGPLPQHIPGRLSARNQKPVGVSTTVPTPSLPPKASPSPCPGTTLKPESVRLCASSCQPSPGPAPPPSTDRRLKTLVEGATLVEGVGLRGEKSGLKQECADPKPAHCFSGVFSFGGLRPLGLLGI